MVIEHNFVPDIVFVVASRQSSATASMIPETFTKIIHSENLLLPTLSKILCQVGKYLASFSCSVCFHHKTMDILNRRTASSYVEFLWAYCALTTISLFSIAVDNSLIISTNPILHVLHWILLLVRLPFRPFPGFLALGLCIAAWNARDLTGTPLWQNLALCGSVIRFIIEGGRVFGRLHTVTSFLQLHATRFDVAFMAWLVTSILFDFRWDGGYLDADVWMAESTCKTSREFRVWMDSGESEVTPAVKEMMESGETIEEIRKVAYDWKKQDRAFRVWRESGERVKRGIVKEMLSQGYAINRLREISKRIEEEDARDGGNV